VEARVRRISIAPVKALGLVHPDEVVVGAGGVAGDRRFWLRDSEGRLFNGKREGRLLQVRPEWDESSRRLVLTFPGGERVEGIVELGEVVDALMYGEVRASRQVVGPWQDALSEFAGRPLELLWAEDGGVDRLTDLGTVSLVSTASLERLGEEMAVEGPVDGRRFRMLFEIDGVRAHAEDTWIGRHVRIGGAEIVVQGDVGRCVVTSRDPDSGVVDLPTLVTLAAYRREGRNEPLPFGVKGTVHVPGRVRVGDIATPLYSPEWQPAAATS
jgi:MOSC domain-containing protein